MTNATLLAPLYTLFLYVKLEPFFQDFITIDYWIELQTVMEEDMLVTRLDYLFQNKVLDDFVREYKNAEEKGIDLRELGVKHGLKYDLQVQYGEMRRILDMVSSMMTLAKSPNQGWKNIPIDNRCSLGVRSNHTLLEIKSTGIIDCNLTHLLYLAYLIKLYKHCLPFCKEAHDIMEPTRLEKVGFVRLSIPIPFVKDRCTYLRGVGIDRLKNNSTVCIFAEGINQNKDYLERYKIEIGQRMKGKELLDLKHFAVQITRINDQSCAYSGYALVDHHIPLIPEAFIALVAKELAKYLFHHLLDKLKYFQGSVWDKERKENYEDNREFYDWLDSKKEDIQKASEAFRNGTQQ